MEEDSSWVFDSLVGFLRGPVWNVPILTFIENKSLIFEPDCEGDDDHRQIHEEYKNLVDFMLGSYMEDIGITPEQFEAACGKATANIKDRIHQTLFEQVWAADDYEIFHRMMIQKNLELQLQALELLQKKYGIVPESFVSDGTLTQEEKTVMESVIKYKYILLECTLIRIVQFTITSLSMSPTAHSDPVALEEAERKVLDYALKKSLEEHEAYMQGLDEEKIEFEKTLALSKEEITRLEGERDRERELMMMALSTAPENRDSMVPQPKSTTDINPEELAKRQAYLREQRDKLLELKRKEREKQLSSYEESAPQTRPKSSRAARKVMKGNAIDPQTLQVRRTLAERLKAEVIDQ